MDQERLDVILSIYFIIFLSFRERLIYSFVFISCIVASSLGKITRTDGVIKNNGNLTFAAELVINLAKRMGAIEILVGLPLDSNGMSFFLPSLLSHTHTIYVSLSIDPHIHPFLSLSLCISLSSSPPSFMSSFSLSHLSGRMSYKVKNFNGNLCLNFSQVVAAVAQRDLPRAKVKVSLPCANIFTFISSFPSFSHISLSLFLSRFVVYLHQVVR